MALTLIKEDGTGKTDANSYADVADGNAYYDGHLYATAWTGAGDDQKAVALVMASRLIDAEFQFNGTRTNAVQGLQWPRAKCPEPDAIHVPLQVLLPIPSDYVRYDSVPKAVVQATCEMARELLIADRTVAPAGEGLKYQIVGSTQTGYDKADKRPVISPVAQAMLIKFGSLVSAKSGAVRLVRA
jgi:DNA topoisomerase VI subunit B